MTDATVLPWAEFDALTNSMELSTRYPGAISHERVDAIQLCSTVEIDGKAFPPGVYVPEGTA
jgi:hypothetical protein